MIFNKEKFGKEVSTYRWIDKRISLGKASIEIGVSKATLSRVERGNLPDVETFAKICKWMKVNHSNYFNQ